jgi:hypothetical protein
VRVNLSLIWLTRQSFSLANKEIFRLFYRVH